ncbi:calcium-transporting ATPase type 2C member 1-like isoform X2 [Homarus americanus]|uniref:calcium-transporting ATPase type 2C member 1-like isoform X2 n=1 Tax=Homarus americanus TaxID=6706 RepID=UPI001C4869B4|nr:calcium-transporting ATPase type 2C member 1-like isoform X2 [Homarus americanus]XP_042226859.1 calcium-transporting ATPase type 2C member 1-like isoform X2 [Homarus americanus]XP_042226860.1 calcium-transporting ATPase type 2C member 1-like isoform X2 [Homarus americanus]
MSNQEEKQMEDEGTGLLSSSVSTPEKTTSEQQITISDTGGSGMWVSGREGGGLPWEEVARLLLTDPNVGLPPREVITRRQLVGYNEFSETEDDPMWKKYLGQFKEPLILLLLASSFVSLCMGQFDDAVVITLAIVIVATVAFTQELRTDKALEELKKQVPATCMCLRDGNLREYQARELVPGDIVHLSIGDRVPADLRLFESADLSIDESSFTGETEPAPKFSNITGTSTYSTSGSMGNLAYMGTFVRTGRGKGIVISTGEKSQFGELFRMMQEEEAPRTPLQKNMDELAKKLSIFSFCFIGVVFILGLYQSIPIHKIFNIAVSLAVAAIPEGLPIVVTMTLCLGIRRMAKRSALVKGLHTVETLGCVTTVCSDKTGTLTKNEMTVTSIVTSEGDECHVTGVGYSTDGEVVFESGYSELANEAVTKLLETGAVCNNAQIVGGQLLGQPTEGAILAAALKHGIFNARDKYQRLEEFPFKSETKTMSLKVRNKKTGEVEWLVKGSVEAVLRMCSHYHQNMAILPLSQEKQHQILSSSLERGRLGLRVIGIARGASSSELSYMGMLGIMDPPREGARSSVTTLQSTGVNVKMVTGDAQETACAIAQAVGLRVRPGTVFSGDQLDSMDERMLLGLVQDATVFYRVSPRHKVRIVKALQECSEIVGMTGDGVNDVVALKRANIGISMGKMGTAVSKEAADMILNDDDFTTILSAIEEGKCIFHNITNFVQFQVSTSLVALSLIALSTLLGLPSPLNPMQILLINVIMDGPPALTLGMEPIDDDVKVQPPRDTKKDLITKKLIRNCIISASVIICGTLWVFRSEMMDGVVTARDTTMTFACFVMYDMFNAMSCRSDSKSVLEIGITSNWYLFVALTATFVCLMGVVYLPFLQWVFQTESIYLIDWLYLTCLTSTVLIVSELRKFFDRRLEYSSAVISSRGFLSFKKPSKSLWMDAV